MGRANVEGAELRGNVIWEGNRLGVVRMASAAEFTIGEDFPHFIQVDATEAQDVNLPDFKKGLWYLVANDAESGGAITLKDEDDTTIASVAAGGTALVACDGVSWYALVGAH